MLRHRPPIAEIGSPSYAMWDMESVEEIMPTREIPAIYI
jgi:hypothetical protein